MKNIFFKIIMLFVFLIITSFNSIKNSDCSEKDELIRKLVKFNNRLEKSQAKILDARIELEYVVHNMENTVMPEMMRGKISKTDSLLKKVTEISDMTTEELHYLYEKNNIDWHK